MEVQLLKDDLVPQLWNAYTKAPEYKQGIVTIPANHRLVVEQESLGLKSIYKHFVGILLGSTSVRENLKIRTPSLWLEEWKNMHNALYEHVLKRKLRGITRETEVRFGNPGDEILHKIPVSPMVLHELSIFAEAIQTSLVRRYVQDEEKYIALARIHYQFIRIHPFPDGNGRIARALTDQIAVYFGLPVAMGGFPRHDSKRRQAYHKAIFACINDPDCMLLALWIKNYIDIQLRTIA